MRTRYVVALVGLLLVLAAPALAEPGVGGYPVEQYAPSEQFVTVHAYNPTDELVRVSVGSDVDWLHPALETVALEPGEQFPLAVRIIRPVDENAVGHVTLTVRQDDAVGGVGLAIVNAEAPAGAFPIIPAVGIAALVLALVMGLVLVRRRRARPRAWGFGT